TSKSTNIEAQSIPIAPAPIIHTRLGNSVKFNAPVDDKINSSSNGNSLSFLDSEPIAIIIFLGTSIVFSSSYSCSIEIVLDKGENILGTRMLPCTLNVRSVDH